MRLQLGKGPSAFVDPGFDPTTDYVSPALDDAFLDNLAQGAPELDLERYGVKGLELATARAALRSTLRQQQYLVYGIATRVGVLAGQVQQAREALRLFDLQIDELASGKLAQALASTFIGAAASAMALVPIYGQIAAAALRLSKFLVGIIVAGDTPGTLRQDLLPAQSFSTATDADLFNNNVRLTIEAGADWTSMFHPAMQGALSAQVVKNSVGQHVIQWGLGDGTVPRVVIDSKPLSKPWTYHYSDGAGKLPPPVGRGGVGFMPGTMRITTRVQSTMLEPPRLGPGHNSLFDPRCGGVGKVRTIDIGSYYPTTTNGLYSLWQFVRQQSPAMYTVDVDTLLASWEAYFDAIWEGVRRLWRNPSWEGGWGCGVWSSALSDLVGNFTVGFDGSAAGALSWRPPTDGRALNASDDKAWESNNLFVTHIRPALLALKSEQKRTLAATPIAAYLPAVGDENLDEQMAAFRSPQLAMAFRQARRRILTSNERYIVRVDDVLDADYLDRIEARGGGTTVGKGGMDGTIVVVPSDNLVGAAGKLTGGGGDAGGGGWAAAVGAGVLVAGGLGLALRLRRRR